MAEVASRCHAVAHELLEFLRLGESPSGDSRNDRLADETIFKYATFARPECDLAKVLRGSREQLLGHPSRTRQPATLVAGSDPDTRPSELRAHPPHDTPRFQRRWRSPTQTGGVTLAHVSAVVRRGGTLIR